MDAKIDNGFQQKGFRAEVGNRRLLLSAMQRTNHAVHLIIRLMHLVSGNLVCRNYHDCLSLDFFLMRRSYCIFERKFKRILRLDYYRVLLFFKGFF